ncbi:MAG: SIS domain-containing protein [Betaproteobacteria bacterium]|nr:SIS domain-containing protein [Betaproteobacteria bacterium]
MLQESRAAPAVVATQIAADADAYREFGDRLRFQPPTSILTVARGSSDHAAHFMAYLIMARLGRLVTSLPLSLITLYQSKIRCEGLLSMAFSQSGQSPDLVASMRFFSDGGAATAAFVNDSASPLAASVQSVFCLHAGREQSVAATKSFIAQLVAGVRVVGAWQPDAELDTALQALPEALSQACRADWSAAVAALQDADRLFVIGRGTGLPIAMEAALKFKETCALQAEAFSGAEVMHGPMAMIEPGFPLLVFAPRGPAHEGLVRMAAQMRERGATVLLAAPPGTPGCNLPLVAAPSVELDPITAIQSFYPLVEALSRARGFDPDRPRHLQKVTRTR